jgi:hypothetical protein
MRSSGSQVIHDPKRLVLLADGGALADLNERLADEGAGARKDFAKVPSAVIKALRDEGAVVDSPIEFRFFCTVGSEKAQGFVAKMAESWTVKPLALSFAKYERSGDTGKEKHRFRIRFHAYLGYSLGLLTAAHLQPDVDRSRTIVGIVTDDCHLLPCMADSRANGIDVRLVWWQASVSDELSYLAARNDVKLLLLPGDDGTDYHAARRDAALETLMRSAKWGGSGLPQR